MGYEITYSYHNRLDEGGYENDTKTMKKKLGDPFEDVILEKLAGTIMSQLARRDIWITDVEIYELRKHKISYKETKGGIVVKNHKFVLDNNAKILMEKIVEEKPVEKPLVPIPSNNGIIPPVKSLRPIKWVMLDGDINNLHKIKGSGLQFSVNKRYPVFSEIPHPRDFAVTIYNMHDDHNREVSVKNEYFLPADVFFEKETKPIRQVELDSTPKLAYQDEIKGEMPDLR